MNSPDLQPVHLYVKGHNGGKYGTWACCLNIPNTDDHKLDSGKREGASHNAMEIEACVRGFEMLKRPCLVNIFTNSMYLKDGINLLLNGTHYESNPLLWLRLIDKMKGHVVYCQHLPKVDNTGYMRLVDSTALNLLSAWDRRVR